MYINIKDIQVTRKNVSEVVPPEPTAPTDFASATQVQTNFHDPKRPKLPTFMVPKDPARRGTGFLNS